MINADEDALICDFAETYHIFNYRGLSLKQAAILACGLRENSRIVMKMSRTRVDNFTLLLASAIDNLKTLVWQNTESGHKGTDVPKSIAQALLGIEDEKEFETYTSGDEFMQARQKIIEEINGN